MRTTLKKLIALAVCAVLLVGVLAACNKAPAPVETAAPTNDYSATSGVVVLNTGAVLSIRYDVEGNVDGITGDNDGGVLIMEEYADFEGKATVDVMKALVAISAEKKILTEEISTVLIKITSGTVFASEESRNTLVKAVQDALTEAGSKAVAMLIDDENLTGEGYLTLATVKTLIMNKLGVDKFDAFYGDTLPSNNYYLVTVQLGDTEYSYSVDAYNGFISIASQEELLGGSETEDTTPVEDTIPVEPTEFIEETVNQPTEDASADIDYPVIEEDADIDIPLE